MKRTGLGRILWWAAPILLAVGIASRAADLREIAASLVGVKPGWVAAALVLGVLFTLNQGALYRRSSGSSTSGFHCGNRSG